MSHRPKWLILSVIVLPIDSFGHHSGVQYDRENIGEVSGVVVDLLWANPHIWVDVQSPTGEIWEIEFQAPRHMTQVGLQRSDVEVGTQVTIAGLRSLQSPRRLSGRNLLRSDCTELAFFGAKRRWQECDAAQVPPRSNLQGDDSNPEAGIFRVWVVGPDGFHPLNNGNPDAYPLNDAALAAYSGFDRALSPATSGCTPKGMPTIMDNPLNYEFVERENSIEFLLEEYDIRRVIHMDRESPPPGEAPSPLGYSVGKWVGETLEIETTLIDWPWINQAGMPQSTESVIVERFTPEDGGARLRYLMTITDPVYLTEPLTLENIRIFVPNIEMERYDCQAKD